LCLFIIQLAPSSTHVRVNELDHSRAQPKLVRTTEYFTCAYHSYLAAQTWKRVRGAIS